VVSFDGERVSFTFLHRVNGPLDLFPNAAVQQDANPNLTIRLGLRSAGSGNGLWNNSGTRDLLPHVGAERDARMPRYTSGPPFAAKRFPGRGSTLGLICGNGRVSVVVDLSALLLR